MNLPLIGLGTWNLRGSECEQVIRQALELGYRHIDTADSYENHLAVGKAVQSFPREELFITTKLWLDDLIPSKIFKTTERFLEELQMNYVDLLLIHWPNPEVNLVQTLLLMLELQNRGVTRFIGVSNFVPFHLKTIAPYHFPILTNQVELQPYFQRKELVKMCQSMGIKITAYRPLAKGAVKEDSLLKEIGSRYGKNASQVALRWMIQQDFTVIPKASSYQNLKDNMEIFDFRLTAEEMNEIETLDSGRRFCAPEGLPIYDDDAHGENYEL